jgi:hypothetical protein
LEIEDDDFNNYIPFNNPSKPISTQLEAQMVIDHGRKHSCILLNYHLKICDQVLYLPSRLHCPPRVTFKFVEKDQNRQSINTLQLDIGAIVLSSTHVFTLYEYIVVRLSYGF